MKHKRNRKIIFLDIDGTLTTMGRNVPPDSAVEAIRKAQAAGHLVYLCTGRNYAMMAPLMKYGFDGAVASAGGHIRCKEEVIYDCPMETELRDRTMQILADYGIFRTIECLDQAFTDGGLKEALAKRGTADGSSELLRWHEAIEKELNIQPMEQYRGQKIYKIVVMSESGEKLMDAYRLLEKDFQLCMQDFDGNGFANGELINRRFNKGTAVERVCQYLGIPVEDSVAFGDSMNDKDMIERAGLGIAMENGSPYLKQAADDICPPMDEDGIYRAFEKHGLIKKEFPDSQDGIG